MHVHTRGSLNSSNILVARQRESISKVHSGIGGKQEAQEDRGNSEYKKKARGNRGEEKRREEGPVNVRAANGKKSKRTIRPRNS